MASPVFFQAFNFHASVLAGVVCAIFMWSVARSLFASRKTEQRHFSEAPPFASTTKSTLDGKTSHSTTFPPSQRQRLGQLCAKAAVTNGEALEPAVISSQLLKMDEDYDSAESERTLFSGFKVSDVIALGDFPDYATLSEVPRPKPIRDFDITTAKGRPYRPFRWPYHQTMSIHRMDPDYWIELDDTYSELVQTRKDIHAKHGTDIVQALPGSKHACKELFEMVIQFLCTRYPTQFERQGKTFCNHILGKLYNISATDPLIFLLENVPEDFAIMLRDPETGTYKFRAGVICASTGWSLGTKIGMGLQDIHSPVPDYKQKMQMSMDRFFTKMPTSKPVQRGAWGFEVGKHLYTPPNHPDLGNRDSQNPSLDPEDIYLRVDWQTLRRLPLSGAIVFNFKVFFTPVAELKDEPYIPSLSLKVFADSKDNLRKYKEVHHTEHILKPLLAEYEKHQIDKGIIKKDWEPHTLAENPFFPGWEEKWRRIAERTERTSGGFR